jgi:hypothetical protein
MEMTRRQFALSVAADASLHSSLFDGQLSPIGVHAESFPAESPGRTIRRL